MTSESQQPTTDSRRALIEALDLGEWRTQYDLYAMGIPYSMCMRLSEWVWCGLVESQLASSVGITLGGHQGSVRAYRLTELGLRHRDGLRQST